MNYGLLDMALDYIQESMDADEGHGALLRPVFVVLLYSDSTFDHVVEKFVKGQSYWHAAISFGPSLSRCYSFNFGEADANKHKGGLSFESLDFYQKYHPTGTMQVNALFLSDEKYKALKKALDFYMQHKEKTSYNFINLLTQFLGKEEKVKGLKYQQVCSTFVDSLLKAADIDINSKDTSLVKPDDLKNSKSLEKYYKIFEGNIVDYKVKKAIDKSEKLANNANSEYVGKK